MVVHIEICALLMAAIAHFSGLLCVCACFFACGSFLFFCGVAERGGWWVGSYLGSYRNRKPLGNVDCGTWCAVSLNQVLNRLLFPGLTVFLFFDLTLKLKLPQGPITPRWDCSRTAEGFEFRVRVAEGGAP